MLVSFRSALVPRISIQSPFGILKTLKHLQPFQSVVPPELFAQKMDNETYKECLLIEYAAYYRTHDKLAKLLVGKDASKYSQVPMLCATLSSIIDRRAVESFDKAVDTLWELYEFASDLIPFESFGYLLIDIILFKILVRIKECGSDDDEGLVNDILGLCRIPGHIELDHKDRKWLQEKYKAISTKLIFVIHNGAKALILHYFKRLITCNCFLGNIKDRVNMYLDKVNEKFGPPGLELLLRLNGKQINKQKRGKKEANIEQSSASAERKVNPFISRKTLTEKLGLHFTKDTAAIPTEKEPGDTDNSSSSTDKDLNLFRSRETVAKTVRSNRGKDSAAIHTEKEQGDAEKSSSSADKDLNLFRSRETVAKTVRSNRGNDSAGIHTEKEQRDAEKSSSSADKDLNLFRSRETVAKAVRSNRGNDSAAIHTEKEQGDAEKSSSSAERNLKHFRSGKTLAETVDINTENLNTDAEISPVGGFDQREIDEGQQREILSNTKCPCGFSDSEKESQESEPSLQDVVEAFNDGICSEVYDPRDCKARRMEDYSGESDDENDCGSIVSECFDIVEQTNSNKETDNFKHGKSGDIEEAGCSMFNSGKSKQKDPFQQRKSTSHEVVKTVSDESCKDINKLSDNEVCGETFDGGSDCSMLSECFDMVKEMDDLSHDKNKENSVQETECAIFSNDESKEDDRHEFQESESEDNIKAVNECKNMDEESQESDFSTLSECFDMVKQSDGNEEMHDFSRDENDGGNGKLNHVDEDDPTCPVTSDICDAKEQADRMSQSCDSLILFDSYDSESDDRHQELETDTSTRNKESDSGERCSKPLDNKDSSICSMDIDEPNKLIGVINAHEKVDNMDPSNQISSNNDFISNQNDTTNLPVRTTSPLQTEGDFPDLVNQPSSNDLPTRQTQQKDEPSSKNIDYPKHVKNKQKKIVATVKPLVKSTDIRSPTDHFIRASHLNDERHTTAITNTSVVHETDGLGTELPSTKEQTSSSENDLSSLSRRNDILNTLETIIQAFNHACSAMISPKDNNNNDKTNEKNASDCLPSGSTHPPLTTFVHSPNIWQCATINSPEILSSLLLSLEELNDRAGLSEQNGVTNESKNNCVNPTKLPRSVVSSEVEKLSSSSFRNGPGSQINEDQPESNVGSCEDQPNGRHFIESQQRFKAVSPSGKESTTEILHVSEVSANKNHLGGKDDDESSLVACYSVNTQVCSINQNPHNSSDNMERTFRNISHDHSYSLNTNSKEAVDVRKESANQDQLGGKGDSLTTNDLANDGSASAACCSANTQVCSLNQNPHNSSRSEERTFRYISHDHSYSVNTNSKEAVDGSNVSANKNQLGGKGDSLIRNDHENDESTSAACCSANTQVHQNPHNSSCSVERTFRNISHDHSYSGNTNSALKKVPKKRETSSGEQRISRAQTARQKEHETILNISHDHCSSANDANNIDFNRKRSSSSKLSPQLSKKRVNKGVRRDTGKSFIDVCACSSDTAQDSQSVDVDKTPVIKVENTDSTNSLTRVLPRNIPSSIREPEFSKSLNVLDPSNAESEEDRSSVKSPSIFDLSRPTSSTEDETVCSCSETYRWSSTDESSLESQRNSNAVNKTKTFDSIRDFVPFIKKENVEEPIHQIIDEFKDCSEVVCDNPTKCSDLTRYSNALSLKKDTETDLRSSFQLGENPEDCSAKCTGLLISNEHLTKSEDLNETSGHLSKSSNLKIMRSYKRKNFHGNSRSQIEPIKSQEINFAGSSSEARTPDAHVAVPSNFKDHSSEVSNVEGSKDSEESNVEASEISVASKHDSDETYKPSDSEASESSTISDYEPSENSQMSSYEPTTSSENSNFVESETTGASHFESDETYEPSNPEVCESSTTSDSEPSGNSEVSSFEPGKNSETPDCKASRTFKASKFESDKTHKPLNLEASESSDLSDTEPRENSEKSSFAASENSEKSSFAASENSEMTNFWESESSGDETYKPSTFEESGTSEISDFESSKTSEISNVRGRKISKKSDFKWSTTTEASNVKLSRIRPGRKRRCRRMKRTNNTTSLSKYKCNLEAVVKLEKFEMESLQRTGILLVHK